jgi:biopolymer transport protein ExbB
MMPGRYRGGVLSVAAMLAVVLFLPISAHSQETTPSSPTASSATVATAPPPPAQPTGVGTATPTASAPAAPTGVTTPDQLAGGLFGFPSDDLSPWGMFLHADIVVQIVIGGLAFASSVTWTIWLAKLLELTVAKRRLRRAYRTLRDAHSLTLAAERVDQDNGVARALVREASEEWQRSAEALDDRDGLKERIALHLERVEAIIGRRMMVGTGILATIGSTAPFVGLFGTVWGIMNSFIGISKMHTTNLAVVAPGIAEALLATACGLIAAIPAVVIYNHFVRQIAAYKALVANAASAVMALVSRDLSHGDHAITDVSGANALRRTPEKPDGNKPLRMVAE